MKTFLQVASINMLFGLGLFVPAQAESQTVEESPLTYVWQGQSLLGYSEILGDDNGNFNTSDSWLASGSYRVTETDRIMFSYNGSFEQSQLFIAQDEGSVSSDQLMSHNFTLSYHRIVNNTWSLRPYAFYNAVYIKQTNDEELGNGLYDYHDSGAAIESVHDLSSAGETPRTLTASIIVFDRTYPRFQSLFSVFDPNSDVEKDEKDFIGYKVDVSYETQIDGHNRGKIAGQYLFKDFEDKKTIDLNGIRRGDERRDHFLQFLAEVQHQHDENVVLSLISLARQNFSNLDFYDTRNSASLSDDRFFEGYFDYLTYEIRPSVTMRMSLIGKNINTFKAGYSMEGTYYHGRNALTSQDLLTDEDQMDYKHGVFTVLNIPLNEHWNSVTTANYTRSASNQKFEDFYRYNYETWSLLSGLSAEY